ncbi:MAG TPA: A24 family peptidase [Xanthomonadaceae bacterium]|nr:A24 family peptidase [Xanthomonadaceae bacterium]
MELLADYPGLGLSGALLLGLVVGSFLNVVALRLPPRLEWAWRAQAREFLDMPEDAAKPPPGLVWERSHCPACKTQLTAWENIPLVSWLALRGRCRHCGVRISLQYPVVEALTGIASLLVVWHFGLGWAALAALALTWFLIAMSVIDLRTTLLPDGMTLPLLWLGLLLSVFGVYVDAPTAIIGAAVGYLSLWSVYWLFKLLTGKEGMGYGDFKLLAALGAFCGWQAILPILLLSSFFGAVIGGVYLAMRGKDRATPIPFGPFLAGAGWFYFLWGERLLGAWLRMSGLA